MPGNRAIFERAMEQSRESARQNQWADALKSAIRALQEFPLEGDARTSAAVALFHTGQFDRALQLFADLRASDPSNPFFLSYIAQAQARQGDHQAIASYRALADLHHDQRRPLQAAEALRELLKLQPEADSQREDLARLYEEAGLVREAAAEWLTLARRRRQAQQIDQAAEAAEAALRLEPGSPEAKELIAQLREHMARAAGLSPEQSVSSESHVRRGSGKTGALRSQQFALEKLVEQAQHAQEAGNSSAAITLYEQALAGGLERADLYYSLALIYQTQAAHEQAVALLNRAVTDPEYALSAHFALGQSYRELGRLPQAAEEFEQTIRLVDLETIGRNEADDLIQMYVGAATIYEQIGDIARAAALYGALASFLEEKRWGRERATELKRRAQELSDRHMFAKLRTMGSGSLERVSDPIPEAPDRSDRSSGAIWAKLRPVTDLLHTEEQSAAGTDPAQPLSPTPTGLSLPVTTLNTSGLTTTLTEWIELSGHYVEQGLFDAALDACHEVIRCDPHYLPIHLRMGEIYERQGRPAEALTKYQLLIDTFSMRGEFAQAIDVYFRLIELAPDSTGPRARLAELLYTAGRLDEAVAQLLQIAATDLRLEQTSRALEAYRRLLQWAPASREVHAQYGLTLLKLGRYEAALGEFRRALELGAPDDPVAVARLNITLALMGAQPATIWDSLTTLLNLLKQQPDAFGPVQAEYRAALVNADAAHLHYILAIIQQCAERHTSALLSLEQAEVLITDRADPLLPLALIAWAVATSQFALGNPEGALQQLRHVLLAPTPPSHASLSPYPFARPPSRSELALRIAALYRSMGNLLATEQSLTEARALLPDDTAIAMALADTYAHQGKLALALAQLDELALRYEAQQHLDRALELLEHAYRLAPHHAAIGMRLARLQLRRGYLDQGVARLIQVAELQLKTGQLKESVAALQEVAQVYWMAGNRQQVRAICARILQIAPGDLEVRHWLALIYTLMHQTTDAIAAKKWLAHRFVQLQNYPQAIAELHQIIALDQQDREAYMLLGDLLTRQGESAQAERIFARMRKLAGADREHDQGTEREGTP